MHQWWLYMQAKIVIGSPRLAKKCINTLAKKILYAKLNYYNYLNKNFKNPNMRITKI